MINDTHPASAGNSPHAVADRAAMQAEAQQIAEAHPDILSSVSTFWDGEKLAPLHQQAPPVIITIPADLCSRDLEVLVRHEFGRVLVDLRGERHQSWTPAALCGVDVEIRER